MARQMRLRPTRPPCVIEALERRVLLTTIDVMVLYSSDTIATFGGIASADRAVRQTVDAANLAHQNTADQIVMRLVHTQSIAYAGSGSLGTDLDRLANPADGHLDSVHDLRYTYGADLVVLVTSSESGGLATLLNAPSGNDATGFSAMNPDSFSPGSLVPAHEWGHNLGANHNREEGIGGVFPGYSYGYHAIGNHGTHYKDLMSYGNYLALPVFATPTFLHDGVPMGKAIGDPNAADLLSTFLVTGPAVAGYRTSAVADAAPTASLWQTNLVGDTLTFRVRYIDDIAVSAASFDDRDAYVQTPEGFQLRAEFVAADVSGDGYARLVTYRVTLPGNPVNLSALGFFLNAGQVVDSGGNPVAGGSLALNLDGDLTGNLGSDLPLAFDTGPLAAGEIRRLSNNAGTYRDQVDIYKFTVTSNMSLEATLSGIGGPLTNDANLNLFKDANLNEVEDVNEPLIQSTESGFAEKHVRAALTPGTWYLYLYSQPQEPAGTSTSYTLTLRTTAPVVGDSIAPTALANFADPSAEPPLVTFAVLYRDDRGLDLSSLNNARVDVTLSGTVGSDPVTLGPWITTVLDDRSASVVYEVNFGGPLPAGAIVNVAVSANSALKDSSGNNIATGTPLGSYTVMPAAADTAPPTAIVLSTLSAVRGPSGTGPAQYSFTILYNDNRGIDSSTLGTGDFIVSGPNGFSQAAVFDSQSLLNPGIGSMRVASYRFTAPGGSWDWNDDGYYTIAVAAGQVKDPSGNSAAAGPLGQLLVDIPIPGDANGDRMVDNSDFAILYLSFGKSGRGVPHGDFNYNGVVSFADYQILEVNFGRTITIASHPLSEPSGASTPNDQPADATPSATDPQPITEVAPTTAPEPVGETVPALDSQPATLSTPTNRPVVVVTAIPDEPVAGNNSTAEPGIAVATDPATDGEAADGASVPAGAKTSADLFSRRVIRRRHSMANSDAAAIIRVHASRRRAIDARNPIGSSWTTLLLPPPSPFPQPSAGKRPDHLLLRREMDSQTA